MKEMTVLGMAQFVAEKLQKPCLYLSSIGMTDLVEADEVHKAVPYLPKDHELLFGDRLLLIFDTEEERDKIYEMTVGDEGSTETNSYDGPAAVYAITIGRDGMFGTENT